MYYWTLTLGLLAMPEVSLGSLPQRRVSDSQGRTDHGGTDAPDASRDILAAAWVHHDTAD